MLPRKSAPEQELWPQTGRGAILGAAAGGCIGATGGIASGATLLTGGFIPELACPQTACGCAFACCCNSCLFLTAMLIGGVVAGAGLGAGLGAGMGAAIECKKSLEKAKEMREERLRAVASRPPLDERSPLVVVASDVPGHAASTNTATLFGQSPGVPVSEKRERKPQPEEGGNKYHN